MDDAVRATDDRFRGPDGTGEPAYLLQRMHAGVYGLEIPFTYRDPKHETLFVIPADVDAFTTDLGSIPRWFTWLEDEPDISMEQVMEISAKQLLEAGVTPAVPSCRPAPIGCGSFLRRSSFPNDYKIRAFGATFRRSSTTKCSPASRAFTPSRTSGRRRVRCSSETRL